MRIDSKNTAPSFGYTTEQQIENRDRFPNLATLDQGTIHEMFCRGYKAKDFRLDKADEIDQEIQVLLNLKEERYKVLDLYHESISKLSDLIYTKFPSDYEKYSCSRDLIKLPYYYDHNMQCETANFLKVNELLSVYKNNREKFNAEERQNGDQLFETIQSEAKNHQDLLLVYDSIPNAEAETLFIKEFFGFEENIQLTLTSAKANSIFHCIESQL